MVILVQNFTTVTIQWAFIRGLATALMHGVCTIMIGYGMSFVRKKRQFFYCGTFALLIMAILYHGIFNMLVQSDHYYIGFILPGVTYIPILVSIYEEKKKASEKNNAARIDAFGKAETDNQK